MRQRVSTSERGSALLLAVIVMLAMGVLSVSFALLADIETRTGVDYKQQAQAEALAEAALDRARDAVRTAPTAAGAFTSWINGAAAGMSGAHLFGWNGATLGPGQYWARIDNDCVMANTVPAEIQEPPVGGVACDNTIDTNATAVLTAWAQSGSGASRIRATVTVDTPWKHVCSNARPDNNGYCNEPGNRNGSPTISPSGPTDPNGPAAYDDLPRPVLGCSRVAPGLHRTTHALATQVAGCVAFPDMYAYPYPVLPLNSPRLVIMGELPGPPGAPPRSCNDEPPGGNGNRYFGYFDCALTTFCDPAIVGHLWCGPNAGPGGKRWACVRQNDARATSDPSHYVTYNPVTGLCGSGQPYETGMVFSGNSGTVNFSQTMGSPGKQFDVYILDGAWGQASNAEFYGTLVVEGNGGGGIQLAVSNGGTPRLWSGASAPGPPAGWTPPHTYGYPLVVLAYDPDLLPPTVSPYTPQNQVADFGSSMSQIHGIIYSGGHVLFNQPSLDGGVVAFEIQTQGSSGFTYNGHYGDNAPPPGFLRGSGDRVVMIRTSFIVCANSTADTGANPAPCN